MKKLRQLIKEEINRKRLNESVKLDINEFMKAILLDALNNYIASNKYKQKYTLHEVTQMAKRVQKLNV